MEILEKLEKFAKKAHLSSHLPQAAPYVPNPQLDLVLERIVDLPPEILWQAWTQPEHLKVWFCPKPWSVVDCEIDLRPGGAFNVTMVSPEGEKNPLKGCFLEIIKERKLIWTDSLTAGYRPAEKPFFTGIVTFEPKGTGTLYRAVGIHKDEARRKEHEEMGFHVGWSKALDQLIEHMTRVTRSRGQFI